MRSASWSLLLTFLLLCGACAEEATGEPQAAPAGDDCAQTGCAAGQTCGEDGRCLTDDPGPAEDACAGSDGCWPVPSEVVQLVWWDGGQGGLDLVCTVPPASCPSGGCIVPTECSPAVPDGLPGSFACELDEQCASGRCVDTGEVKLCLRSCHTDSDCPVERTEGVPVAGFVCGVVEERGVSMHSCVPADPSRPAATLCRRDCDCRPGGGLEDPATCAPHAEGEPRCRLVGAWIGSMHVVPVCEVAQEELRPTGSRCQDDPASCDGGGCSFPCTLGSGGQNRHLCNEYGLRCTRPCTQDADCPARSVCGTGRDSERVGDWESGGTDRGRDLQYCQLPGLGCFDQVDCCPEPDGAGGCLVGWTAEPRRCAVTILPPEHAPRLATTCVPLDQTKLLPGACCSAHAECDSALCVPAAAGSPCAGGGFCTVPCEPDPDPDGLPASGDERDRCQSAGLGPAFGATRCGPFLYEGAAGSQLAVELNVCR